MTPYGSPGPRGRTTDHRAEGRTRGRARAKGPKPRGMGRPRNEHRAEARTTRSAPGSRRAEEPPLAARSAQKGRRPKGPTARRRYHESPMATRTIRFVVPRADPRPRKLGAGIDAARGQRRFAPMPQRTGTEVDSFRLLPVGSIVGSTPGAYEPLGEFVTWHSRAPPQRQTRGYAPSWQPFRDTRRLNGAAVSEQVQVCRSFVRAQPSFT